MVCGACYTGWRAFLSAFSDMLFGQHPMVQEVRDVYSRLTPSRNRSAMKSNAENWKSVYAAYVGAQQEYLQLKVTQGSPRDKLLSDSAKGTLVTRNLEKAHRAMHEFLQAHPALLVAPAPKAPAPGTVKARSAPARVHRRRRTDLEGARLAVV
jgi:hypothetical protein